MRNKGDISRVTFVSLIAFLSDNSTDPTEIGHAFVQLNDLCNKVANGDEESESILSDLREKMEESGKVPELKRGPKPMIDEQSIASEVLSKFILAGAPMNLERLAAMPEKDPLRLAYEKQVSDAIKAARAAARAAKRNNQIAELSAKFARGEIDSLSSAAE